MTLPAHAPRAELAAPHPQAALHAALGAALLEHFDHQLTSAERLLGLVLDQARAVRVRDVERVLALVGQIQAETDGRARLEAERVALLTHAGTALGAHGSTVTLDAFCTLLDPATAHEARARSERLRGLLREVRTEHIVVRALMRQELAFVDHLVRMLGAEEPGSAGTYARPNAGHGASNASAPAPAHRVLDLEA